MNRGERREINKRKWISRLKKKFYSGWRTIVQPIKQSNWHDYHEAKTFDELKKDKFGVLLKKTGTGWSYKQLDIKEEHKRNVENRTLSKEDKEELDEVVEIMNDPWAFEKYCNICDNFETEDCPFKGKIDNYTEWKKINCDKFID